MSTAEPALAGAAEPHPNQFALLPSAASRPSCGGSFFSRIEQGTAMVKPFAAAPCSPSCCSSALVFS